MRRLSNLLRNQAVARFFLFFFLLPVWTPLEIVRVVNQVQVQVQVF